MAITSLARHSPGKTLFQVVRARGFRGGRMEKTEGKRKLCGKGLCAREIMALELRPHLKHAIVPAYWLDRARFFTLPSDPRLPPSSHPQTPAFLESFPSASAADDLLAALKRLVNGSVFRVGDKEDEIECLASRFQNSQFELDSRRENRLRT